MLMTFPKCNISELTDVCMQNEHHNASYKLENILKMVHTRHTVARSQLAPKLATKLTTAPDFELNASNKYN